MPPKLPQLPFITREMLSFGDQAELELEVVSFASITATVSLIGFTRSETFKYNFAHDGDLDEESDVFKITDIPIAFTLETSSVLVERGEYFATVFLRINGTRVWKLASGYVSKQSGISWPISDSKGEFEGGGHFTTRQPSSPGAGNEISDATDGASLWKIHSIKFKLTTDANAADRRVHLIVGGHNQLSVRNFFGSIDQAASLARQYTCASFPSLLAESDDDDILIPIPPNLVISSGVGIATDTTNIQAGDAFSQIFVDVEEFIQG